MVSIAPALRRLKDDLRSFLPDEAILDACRQAGHRWRRRKLDPVATLHLFILQVLNFNTAMNHLRRLSRTAVKAPAYCRARMRLPLAALQQLLADSSRAMRDATHRPDGLWCGLRTYLVDGSSTIAPDTPSSQAAFGQPKGCKPGCGFPVPKVLALFDAFSGLIVQMLALPLFTHEQSNVWRLHPLLAAGDLLVGDRGFCSYAHLAMLHLRGVFGLFRMHQKQIVSFRPHRRHRLTYRRHRLTYRRHRLTYRRHRLAYRKSRKSGKARPLPTSRFVRRLGHWDQIVEWYKPGNRPKWMSPQQYDQLPPSLPVRELHFVLARKGQRTRRVTLVTTLLDEQLYSRDMIVDLYGVRWQAETHFAELKTTLKMRKVRSKTAEGVKKELAVYCLVYNLVRLMMLQAARRQKVDPSRISFIDTVRWLISAQPGEPLPDLIVNPHRPGRHEPRVVKDREDTYTKMTRPRAMLRKELMRKGVAA